MPIKIFVLLFLIIIVVMDGILIYTKYRHNQRAINILESYMNKRDVREEEKVADAFRDEIIRESERTL